MKRSGGKPRGTGADVDLMRSLNRNVAKLAMRMEGAHIADYVTQTQKPFRLIWMSFVGGLARGLGMAISVGFVGALAVGTATYVVVYVLKVFEKVPFLGDFSRALANFFDEFIEKHGGDSP